VLYVSSLASIVDGLIVVFFLAVDLLLLLVFPVFGVVAFLNEMKTLPDSV
jgi:hypothetical protein